MSRREVAWLAAAINAEHDWLPDFIQDELRRKGSFRDLRANDGAGSPPFPDPHNPMLRYLIDLASGMADQEGVGPALVYLAVHAWYEGHIEGAYAAHHGDYGSTDTDD